MCEQGLSSDRYLPNDSVAGNHLHLFTRNNRETFDHKHRLFLLKGGLERSSTTAYILKRDLMDTAPKKMFQKNTLVG